MGESDHAAPATIVDPSDSMVGKVLNERFTVLERIGSGGMGRVYRSMQAPLDRVVALKILNPSYAVEQDPAFAKRFFLEASVTSKLSHPNTITIFDYGRTPEGIFFIAMEYLQGRTLHQVIAAEGNLPPGRAVHIARQMARALREAHGLGIVHRDLKPANVMLMHHGDDEDFVKVLDFGLVKFFTEQPDKGPDDAELTQGGVFLGSPTYMAPEQARNLADPRSDVYSLGVVLYHMLAGRPPFQGKAPVDIILKHVNEPPPSFRPELKIPPDLEAVVMRALAKDPNRRFQSMDDFLDGLKRTGLLSQSDVHHTSGISKRLPDARPPSVGTGPRAATPLLGARTGPRPATFTAAGRTDDEPTRAGKPLGRMVLAAAGMGLALSIGVGVVIYTHTQREVPVQQVAAPSEPAPVEHAEPAPAPVPAPAPPHAAPAPRGLHVESVPAGATVKWGDRLLGTTPLDVKIDAATPPTLSVLAEGYTAAEVAATAQGDDYAARIELVPLAPAPPPLQAAPKGGRKKSRGGSSSPSGYKDDPYR